MLKLIALFGLAFALAGCVAEAPGYGYYPDGYYGYGPEYEPGFAYGGIGIVGGCCDHFHHHDHDHDHDGGFHGHGHGGDHDGVWESGGWGGHGGHGGGGHGGGSSR
ncbi:hypothetical protein FAZ69_25710 [Trinickia terrae]|uniref:Glycine-rich protein n=1 Tax=Trinickia terrae TaxID=2571161 RepID=A0A4U1HTT7_9BURK|nr:hypothetical protein [Trinickia terrae]TKC83094.1 hypothetical protein FAZ69_25710 [Trinickia terrae]